MVGIKKEEKGEGKEEPEFGGPGSEEMWREEGILMSKVGRGGEGILYYCISLSVTVSNIVGQEFLTAVG